VTVARAVRPDKGGRSESTVTGDRLYAHLPPRPAPELDRVLDAVERCVARFGIRRTSMTDIAREMGVARTTLYRQVSSIEEAMALLSSRRFHRFLDELVELGAQGITADLFVQVIVRTVRSALTDPVAQRILHDEPHLLGEYLTSGSLAALAGQVTELLSPVLRAAMGTGLLRPSDPTMAAGWIVRVVLALGAVPPPDDELEATVRFVLEPLLEPDRG
jgi:AcrR family transcriptional regulator